MHHTHAAPTLVVYGNTHYDVIARYDHLPQANDRLMPIAVTLAPGGMGGNVSAVFARLGGNCRFLGPFSDDEDGTELRKDLERDGVNTTWAGTNPGPGVRGLIMVDGNAERAIVGYYRHGFEFLPRSAGQSNNTVLESSAMRRTFHADPIVLPNDAFKTHVDAFYCPMNFSSQILNQVPEHLPVFIDLEGVHLDGMTPDRVEAAIRRASVLFLNQGSLIKLRNYLQASAIDEEAVYRDLTLVETRGSEGCRIHIAGNTINIPGNPVNAIDTTGAGDCFAASFIWKHLNGASLLEAGNFACHIAALGVQAHGSRPGVPSTRPEIAVLASQISYEFER